MRVSPIAVVSLSTMGVASAFSAPSFNIRRQQTTFLQSLAEPLSTDSTSQSGRSKDEIGEPVKSGKLLEGGHVVDFSSVRGPSRAEQALTNARAALDDENKVFDSDGAILGINDEVIEEVGHDLGGFADAQTVQDCGAYLRSMAPAGMFGESSSKRTFSAEDRARFDNVLEQAYVESGEVTSAFAKTFYLGTQLLPEEARRAIWAIYVWCRRTDEIVDAPRDNDEEMLKDLSQWELRLENLFEKGEVLDVLDLCLLDVRIQYPQLPIMPFVDMIRGMLMDVPDLGQDRYDTFDELHLYCYRVAGTVGLMCMPVFGCASGYTEELAKEPALSLGVAFQITNILRDVGEDAVTRGRVYLPREDMAKFGVTEEQLFEQRVDENYIALMKYEIERARMYYERAKRGVPMLSPNSRLPVQSSLDCYGKILDKIEENGYDSLSKRAYVGKWEKLLEIPFSWYRTLDIAKTFPLPFDDKPLDLVEQ